MQQKEAARQKEGYTHIVHGFAPVFDQNSRVLILGTLPSVKSREGQFYYHHPQNRFWRVMAALTKEPLPQTIAEKKKLLHRHGIAIWDVIQSCDIIGSSDSSIKNVTPADVKRILDHAPIEAIFANGGKAQELYARYCEANVGRPAIRLPSTSPANAACSLEKLIQLWGQKLALDKRGENPPFT